MIFITLLWYDYGIWLVMWLFCIYSAVPYPCPCPLNVHLKNVIKIENKCDRLLFITLLVIVLYTLLSVVCVLVTIMRLSNETVVWCAWVRVHPLKYLSDGNEIGVPAKMYHHRKTNPLFEYGVVLLLDFTISICLTQLAFDFGNGRSVGWWFFKTCIHIFHSFWRLQFLYTAGFLYSSCFAHIWNSYRNKEIVFQILSMIFTTQ